MLNIFADALLIASGFGTFPADESTRTLTHDEEVRFPAKTVSRRKIFRRVER
jgi:hypothetical protein